MKTVLLKIWNDKLSDYPILDYTFKFWVYGLLAIWVLGMGGLLYGIVSGEADIQNATFGVFDYI
jgi:hypothetical protein